MRVAFIYDAAYPFVKGGAEKRIYEIAKRLAKRHDVDWITLKWWDEENFELDGIKYVGVGEWKELYTQNRRSIKEALYFGVKVLPFLKKQKYDIIDCTSFPYFSCFSAKFASLINRSKLFITWHEVWDDYWYEYIGKAGFFGKFVEKITAKLSDNIIVVSERTKRDLIDMGIKANIKVIPNGIDFEKIKGIKASNKESDVIFVGRLIREKNVDILLKAITFVKKENPDVRCLIIGDGPEKEKLEQLANKQELNNNVEFLGFLDSYEKVISYIKASKVFVLPSTREGFGLVALEANACGIPVVTVNHKRNAVVDLVKNSGYICELSAKDIAEKIMIGLEEGKLMMHKCIKNAKRYEWDEIFDMIANIYKTETK
ncbi:glycosyltransferase family 1 protein [Archaeoglobales archaeon]|nr:MAG: glycosyltransferase family 1 protein [Archaeoglobales archaeon]